MSLRIRAMLLAGCCASVALVVAVHWLGAGAGDASAYTLAFVPCIFMLLDLIDAIVRVTARRRAAEAIGFARINAHGNSWSAALRASPHAFVYAVRDIEHDVDDFLARRAGQREATWIVDLGSDDHTALRIRAAGWRCLEISGIAARRAALARLVRDLPSNIATVIVLDPTSVLATAGDDAAQFERCLRDFQRTGAAAMTPRIGIRGGRLADRMLHLDAVLGFGLTRSALGDLSTIEAATVFRRDALQLLLDGEPLAAQAPELDDTLVTLARGERIYCEPRLEVMSTAPATFGAWLRGGATGWRGTAKAFWKRRFEIDALAKRGPLALYHYVFHAGLLHLFATPLRLVSALVVMASFANALDELAGSSLIPDGIVTHPAVFAAVYLKYLALHVGMIFAAAPRRELPALLALTPLYFFHTLLRGLPPAASVFVGAPRARPAGAGGEVLRA